MQTQDTRFLLRFESGERRGEEVPLARGVTSIGRRSENSVVLKDASVSGRHAEIHVGEIGAEVVDLGSTNGTRLGSKKVERANLAHGDVVMFGSVKGVFCDASFGAPPALAASVPGTAPASPAPSGAATAFMSAPAPASSAMPAAAPAVPAEELGRVSSDKVSRSAARSRRGALFAVLLLALVAAGVFAWRFRGRGPDGTKTASVPSVPGNLLADGSFEKGGPENEWIAADVAPQGFIRAGSFARSGSVGLGVALAGGEWSLARSPEFALQVRRRMELEVEWRVEGNAVGRIGVELASANQELPAFIAWAPAVRSSEGFEHQSFSFDTLNGYDRARVVVAARGEGSFSIDDASVLIANASHGPTAALHESELHVLGAQGSTAVLVLGGRVLMAGIDLSAWDENGLAGWPDAVLSAEARENGLALRFPGAPADAALQLAVIGKPDGPGGAGASDDAWIATIGPEGYQAHATEFTRAQTTALLLGSGIELLSLVFAKPIEVSGAVREGVLFVQARTAGLEECFLQLSFQAERAGAAQAAASAAEAERAGEFGRALASWSLLLDSYPFERELVERAEAARARLIGSGLEQVGDVRAQLGRARFFGLADLFRQCAARARELAAQYPGSEVEAEASALAVEAESALGELVAGGHGEETRNLRAVLEALDPSGSPRLVEHVRAALEEED